jgi:GT2 family glycosyltransferase
VSAAAGRAAAPAQEEVGGVVVNWRQTDATLACLASLERSGISPRAVVIVDNGSGDDFVARVRARYPQANLLPQATNLGFAKAVNIGAQYAIGRGATAVLLLNNDAIVMPDAVRALAAQLHASPTLGVITAKVFLTEAPDHLWAVGGKFTGRRVVEIGAGERDTGAYDATSLDFAYGCALLIRAEVFRELGGLDERFFLYYEDIDLCLRARAAGWEIAMAPAAHVLHEGSKSTRDAPAAKIYHHARSRMLFFSRHVRGANRLLFAASEVAFIARQVAQHVFSGAPRNALTYVRGTLDGLADRNAPPTSESAPRAATRPRASSR